MVGYLKVEGLPYILEDTNMMVTTATNSFTMITINFVTNTSTLLAISGLPLPSSHDHQYYGTIIITAYSGINTIIL